MTGTVKDAVLGTGWARDDSGGMSNRHARRVKGFDLSRRRRPRAGHPGFAAPSAAPRRRMRSQAPDPDE